MRTLHHSLCGPLRRSLITLVAFFALGACFSTAMAQTSTPVKASDINLTPQSCNVSMQLINSILSGVSSTDRDATTSCASGSYVWQAASSISAAGKFFLYFNSLCLVFGGALLLYVTVMGLMKSAEEGEVLGKAWSTVWVPIRVAVGFIAMFPMASGFSGVQIGVLWLAGQGVGAGDYVWSHTVDAIVGNGGDLVALRQADRGAMVNVMRTMLKAETCVAASNALSAGLTPWVTGGGGAGPTSGPYGLDQAAFIQAKTSTGGGAEFHWQNISGGADALDVCGSIEARSANNWLGGGTSAVMDSLWGGSTVRDARTVVQSAQSQGLWDARRVLIPVAQAIVDTPGGVSQDTIVAATVHAADAYREGVASAANGGLSNAMAAMTKGIKDDAAKTGWIGAGAYYYQLSRISSELSTVSSYVPSAKDPQVAADEAGQIGAGLPAPLSMQIDKAFEASIAAHDAVWSAYQPGLDRSNANNASNVVTNNATRYAYEWFSVDPTNSTHALVQLKNVGDGIISAVEGYLVGDAAIKAASELLPAGRVASVASAVIPDAVKGFGSKVASKISSSAGSQFLGGFFSKLLGGDSSAGKALANWDVAYLFGVMMLFSLFGGALMMSVWIPVAPFVIWAGGIFGWVVSIMEMLLAAPLWAAAHLHPDGEGMASKHGANGYMIILEVCLRPLLMIGGLVMAFLVVDPFLRLLSALFFRAMTNANGDTLVGAVTLVAFVAIYIGLCLSVVHRAFALIHLVPNSVFRWIGAHGNSYDDAGHTEKMGAVVAGYIQRAGSAGKIAAPGMAAGAGGAKQLSYTKGRNDDREAKAGGFMGVDE